MALNLKRRITNGVDLTASDHDANMSAIEAAVNGLRQDVDNPDGFTGIATYYQDDEPTPPIVYGSIWVKKNGDEFRWNGYIWERFGDVRWSELDGLIRDPTLGLAASHAKAAAALSTVELLNGQLGVEYKIVVDENGKITGMSVRGGGGVQPTQVIIQADRLVLVQGGPGGVLAIPFEVIGGIVYMKQALIRALSASKIEAGDLKVNNLEASSKLYHASYPSRKFRAIEAATMDPSKHNDPAATHDWSWGLGYAFTHHEPLNLFGPGHPSGGPILNIRDGTARVGVRAVIIGYTGVVTVYYRRVYAPSYNTTGPFVALGSWNIGAGYFSNPVVYMAGLDPTDIVQFFVAPCDGNGDIPNPSPSATVNKRYELDIEAKNWN